jgi:hypothetical protein
MQQASAGDFPKQNPGSENSPETSSVLETSPGSSPASADSSPAKPPVSARKILANRANSLKFTGPTSRAGKNRVRWNSYKHGLLAKALFLRPADGEDAAEFYRFFKALRRDLQPVGMLEDTHLEQAAVSYWSIQRSLRCEGGEIKRNQLQRTEVGRTRSPRNCAGGADRLDHISAGVILQTTHALLLASALAIVGPALVIIATAAAAVGFIRRA